VSDDPPNFAFWKAPEGACPEWDQETADDFVGQRVLVGITYVGPDGKVTKPQAQYHGRIVRVDKTAGIEIACEGARVGKTMTLPPVLSALHLAKPGQYRLRSTGETVDDPDLTSTWTVNESYKS
jgi:hypothetical protein